MTLALRGATSMVAMSTATDRKEPRELASRESNGLAVRLVWDPIDDVAPQHNDS